MNYWKFREINSSIIKMLFSRNFWQKSASWVAVWKTQCGNLQIFPPTIFCKNSVKLTFSLKGYTVNQFDGKFLQWGKISEISTLWKSTIKHDQYFYRKINISPSNQILSHHKNISSNQLFSNLSSKTVTFTKFLPKMHEREFPYFPHCAWSYFVVHTVEKWKIYSHRKFFRQINSLDSNCVAFTKFLPKKRESKLTKFPLFFHSVWYALLMCGYILFTT